MISIGTRSGIFHNFTMNVGPGSKYIEKFRGGLQCYMMESTDFISSITFKLKMKMEIQSLSMVKALLSEYQPKKFN